MKHLPAVLVISLSALACTGDEKAVGPNDTDAGPTNQPLLLWTTYFPLPAGDYGNLRGVLVDEDQNVVAAGTIYDPTGTPRAVVLSADRFGRPRWFHASVGADARDIVRAPDPQSVFVVGKLDRPVLFAVDSAGKKQFEHVCNNMDGVFLSATRDDSRIYLVPSTGATIVTSDLAGNLDCENPIDGAVGDLPRPKIGTVSPFDGALVVAGFRRMSNECWSSGMYPFVQEVDGSSQPVWRLDFESTFALAGTGSHPRLAVADEDGERSIYLTTSWMVCATDTVPHNASYMTAKLDAEGNLKWLNLWNRK